MGYEARDARRRRDIKARDERRGKSRTDLARVNRVKKKTKEKR